MLTEAQIQIHSTPTMAVSRANIGVISKIPEIATLTETWKSLPGLLRPDELLIPEHRSLSDLCYQKIDLHGQ